MEFGEASFEDDYPSDPYEEERDRSNASASSERPDYEAYFGEDELVGLEDSYSVPHNYYGLYGFSHQQNDNWLKEAEEEQDEYDYYQRAELEELNESVEVKYLEEEQDYEYADPHYRQKLELDKDQDKFVDKSSGSDWQDFAGQSEENSEGWGEEDEDNISEFSGGYPHEDSDEDGGLGYSEKYRGFCGSTAPYWLGLNPNSPSSFSENEGEEEIDIASQDEFQAGMGFNEAMLSEHEYENSDDFQHYLEDQAALGSQEDGAASQEDFSQDIEDEVAHGFVEFDVLERQFAREDFDFFQLLDNETRVASQQSSENEEDQDDLGFPRNRCISIRELFEQSFDEDLCFCPSEFRRLFWPTCYRA